MNRRKFIHETLEDINQDPDILGQYVDDFFVKAVLVNAFDPRVQFKLPSGIPPYVPSQLDHRDVSLSNFYSETKRWYIFTKDFPTLGEKGAAQKRQDLFVQLLEVLLKPEVDIMIHVKDQNLQELYTNITADLVFQYGFIDEEAYNLWNDREKAKAEQFRDEGNNDNDNKQTTVGVESSSLQTSEKTDPNTNKETQPVKEVSEEVLSNNDESLETVLDSTTNKEKEEEEKKKCPPTKKSTRKPRSKKQSKTSSKSS